MGSCSILTQQQWDAKGSLLHDSLIVSLKKLNRHYWSIKLANRHTGVCRIGMFRTAILAFVFINILLSCFAIENSNSQSILMKVLIIYVWRRKFCKLYASFRKWLMNVFSVTSGKISVTCGGRVSVYLLQMGSAFLSCCSLCLLHAESN